MLMPRPAQGSRHPVQTTQNGPESQMQTPLDLLPGLVHQPSDEHDLICVLRPRRGCITAQFPTTSVPISPNFFLLQLCSTASWYGYHGGEIWQASRSPQSKWIHRIPAGETHDIGYWYILSHWHILFCFLKRNLKHAGLQKHTGKIRQRAYVAEISVILEMNHESPT